MLLAPLLLADGTAERLYELAPNIFFILGVLFITAWLILRIRKRGVRGMGQPTAREHLERYKTRDAVRGDLEGLMVDIEELARRLGAQLDAKSRELERRIAEADQRIARLGGAALPPAADRFEPQAAAPADPPGEAPDEPGPPASADPGEPPPGPGEDPLVAQVHGLADAGQTASQIAAELGEHIGKIELILALRRA